MFRNDQLDATILLEEPPEIEFIDGLFYVTDRVGNLVIRRCLRPSTFLKGVRRGMEAAKCFSSGCDDFNIAQFPGRCSGR